MSLPLLVAFLGTAIVILTPLCLPLPRRPRDGEDDHAADTPRD